MSKYVLKNELEYELLSVQLMVNMVNEFIQLVKSCFGSRRSRSPKADWSTPISEKEFVITPDVLLDEL